MTEMANTSRPRKAGSLIELRQQKDALKRNERHNTTSPTFYVDFVDD
jgi:hypothetical protein